MEETRNYDNKEYAKRCVKILNAYIDGEQVEYTKTAPNFLSWRTPTDIFLCIGERSDFRIIKHKLMPFTSIDASNIIGVDIYPKYFDENENNAWKIIGVGINFVLIQPKNANEYRHEISYVELFENHKFVGNQPCGKQVFDIIV
jgi:hypothetical protein